MRVLVTGSSGHLGEALVRTFRSMGREVTGVDLKPSSFTTHVGTIADRDFVRRCVRGVDAIIHTATLHKPHVVTHTRHDFIDTNVTGTLNLLEEAVATQVTSFIYTSTTSAFGQALKPAADAPAAWVTEDVRAMPKNIYGVTKVAAEDMCELFHRLYRLPCVILRTARFFLDADDDPEVRKSYDDGNVKANEYLHRRADLQDVVDAHLLALDRSALVGFGRYIISATTPLEPDDLAELRFDAPGVVERRVPGYADAYARRGWRMFPGIDRIYVNERARRELGWQPKYDFRRIIACLTSGEPLLSPLAQAVGSKLYHEHAFDEGPYPVSS